MTEALTIILVVAVGVVLNLGFFFVTEMTPQHAVTMYGTFTRAERRAFYWAWRALYVASFVFNIFLALIILIGLFQ